MTDFAYSLGHVICGVAEIATRVCYGPADYMATGYLTVVFMAVLVLVWLLLR